MLRLTGCPGVALRWHHDDKVGGVEGDIQRLPDQDTLVMLVILIPQWR